MLEVMTLSSRACCSSFGLSDHVHVMILRLRLATGPKEGNPTVGNPGRLVFCLKRQGGSLRVEQWLDRTSAVSCTIQKRFAWYLKGAVQQLRSTALDLQMALAQTNAAAGRVTSLEPPSLRCLPP